MAPLFAQPERQMVTGFPLAITHRKEEINSKYKHALSLFSKAYYLLLRTEPVQIYVTKFQFKLALFLCVCVT